ncbi:hypothetical protein ACPPVV_03310 [Rhodanobacter sp. Col0626]|uniref:hypothetical protein n=1 Tax=Rhodanobacter sp. Col0626 TaxID=3415679 RepID=UPI003CF0FB10
MRSPTSILTVLTSFFVGAAACAATPAQMDAAALRAYAGKPWDKAASMNTTVELGRYRDVPVVADFPCSDVCPQYTVRIIHYRLPADASCASVGGVEKQVLVPIAIAVRTKTVCVPAPLVESGQYYAR